MPSSLEDILPNAGARIVAAFRRAGRKIVLRKATCLTIVVNITTLGVIMEESVSAADANRRFSLILRGVREGQSYVVTSHGRPVARIVPADRQEGVVSRSRATLLSRLERQPVVNAGRWTRDELYEDER